MTKKEGDIGLQTCAFITHFMIVLENLYNQGMGCHPFEKLWAGMSYTPKKFHVGVV